MQILEGINPVSEALKAGKAVIRIIVDRQRRGEAGIQEIVQMAMSRQIVVQYVGHFQMEQETKSNRHQGVIAYRQGRTYVDYVDILDHARGLGQDPLVVVLDDIVDPHNVGAIIRTAEALGAHGLVMHDRRAAGLTPTVVRASAGASEHLLIARVNNIHNTLRDLKKSEITIVGTDVEGKAELGQIELNGPMVVVIGSEERGLSKSVKKVCDYLLKIPMRGQVQSLNASVAAALVLWEVSRNR